MSGRRQTLDAEGPDPASPSMSSYRKGCCHTFSASQSTCILKEQFCPQQPKNVGLHLHCFLILCQQQFLVWTAQFVIWFFCNLYLRGQAGVSKLEIFLHATGVPQQHTSSLPVPIDTSLDGVSWAPVPRNQALYRSPGLLLATPLVSEKNLPRQL